MNGSFCARSRANSAKRAGRLVQAVSLTVLFGITLFAGVAVAAAAGFGGHGTPPVAIIAGDGDGYVGAQCVFDGSNSHDSDGTIVKYEWDFDNNGTWDFVSTSPWASHVFSADRIHNVCLRVTNHRGQTSVDRRRCRVRRDWIPPVAIFTMPTNALVGQAVTLDASWSFDLFGAIKEYKWDFESDGVFDQTSSTPIIQHAWNQGGNYTVTLMVTDRGGNHATARRRIAIQGTADATPQPPVGLTAADRTGDDGGAIQLAWDASTESDVVGYKIYRSTQADDGFELVTQVAGTTHVDTGLTDGVVYYYRVTAVDAASQESDPSATVSATPIDDAAPAIPTGLEAHDVPGDQGDAVAVAWSANPETDLAGYRLTVSNVGAGTSETIEIPSTATTYTASGLAVSQSYRFTLVAYDNAGNASAASAPAVATPTDELAPGAPVGLVAFDRPGDEGEAVVVHWTANSEDDLSGYTLYRAAVPAGVDPADAVALAVPVASLGASAVEWTDESVLLGTQYCYYLVALDESGNQSTASDYAVVQPVDDLAPAAPMNVQAADVAPDQGGAVHVTWLGSLSSDVAGYRVTIADAGGVVLAAHEVGLDTEFTATGLDVGAEYTFTVVAIDGADNVSTPVSVAAAGLDEMLPAVPEAAAAVDVVPDQGGAIVVSWAANSETDLAGYVLRMFDDGGQLLGTFDTGFATSRLVEGLTVGGSFSFDVAARDEHGNVSDACVRVSATANDELAPDAVTAEANDHPLDQGGAIDLSWSAAAASDVVGYKVYRDNAEVATVTGTVWTDTDAGTSERSYTVAAYDGSGNVAEQSNAATATAIDNLAPATPTGVTAADAPDDDGGAIDVSFVGVADVDVDGYRVFCYDATNALVSIAEVAALDSTVRFEGLTDGVPYGFTVLAFDDSGNLSPVSAMVYATSADDLAPAVPADLSAADVPDDFGGAIALTWADVAGADHYSVYRSTTSGSGYGKLADVDSALYTDATATRGTRYYYVVTALDAVGNESAYSAEADAVSRINIPPAAPASVNAVDTPADAGGSIDISWAEVTGAVSYTLSRAAGSGDFEVLAEGVTSLAYTDVAAVRGETFRYVVRAVDADGNVSAASAEASAVSVDNIAPSEPVLTSCEGGDTQVSLTWGASSDNLAVAAYEVWMKEGIGGTWVKQADIDTTAYTKSALANGMTYFFKVRAVDADGNQSPFSGELSATPVRLIEPITLRIEDTDARVSYAGAWNNWGPDPLYSGGTTHYSTTTGASASLTFTGTGISMKAIGATRENRGMAKIYVDGVYMTTVDMYSPAGGYGYTMFDTGVLPDGQHTLKVEVAGIKNVASNGTLIDIDCFDIHGPMPNVTAPAVPSGVSATDATVGNETPAITVNWAANTDADLSSYKVYRSTADGGPYTLIAQLAQPTTTYADGDVEFATRYYYTVTAVDTAANESAQSAQVSARPVQHVAPTAPTLSVSGQGDGMVSLAWTGATDDVAVTGYDVWMKQGLIGAWVKQADVTGELYTKSGLVNGATYYFKVRAQDENGDFSEYSAEVSGVPVKRIGEGTVRIEDTDPRIVYSGLWLAWGPDPLYTNGTTHYSNRQGSRATITFTGTGISVKALGTLRENRGIARVYVDGVLTTTVDQYAAAAAYETTLYEVTGLTDGTHSLALEVSGDKNVASTDVVIEIDCFDVAGDIVDVGTLSAPGPVTVADRVGDVGDALRLSWSASPEPDVTGYNVYRALAADGDFQLVTQALGTTSLVDTTVQPGTTYYYKVSAFDAAGNTSAMTAVASGTPVYDLAPVTPTGVSAGDVLGDDGGSVRVSWSANSTGDTVAVYRVYRSATLAGTYTQIAETAGTSFTDTDVTDETTYYYKVAALNAYGNSSPQSTAVSATPRDNSLPPAIPEGLTASDRVNDTGGVISVAWGAVSVSDLAGYRLYRATSADGPFTMVYQGVLRAYLDTGRTDLTDYFYAVSAYDVDGNESARSAVVSAQSRYDRAPTAVTGLFALGGDGYAGLAWMPATDDVAVTGYEVWMKEGASGEYAKLADNVTTAFTKIGLTNGTTYYFKVRAYNALGNAGPFSNEAVAVPVPSTPGGTTTRVEDTDPAITWSGTWNSWGPDPTYSGGTCKYSATSNSKATLTFNGTGIVVKALGSARTDRGLVDVYVDGVFVTTVDMYAGTAAYQSTIYEASGLSDGQHTLTLRVTGTKGALSSAAWVEIDCFDVIQP